MTKFELNDFVEMMKAQQPENVRPYTWDLLVSSARMIAEHEGDDDVFADLVKDCHRTLDEFSPSREVRDHILMEISRFKRQLHEDAPDSTTAEKVEEPYTVVHDYDGFDTPETHYKVKYHLRKPWRNFKAGQTITYWEGRQCVGGYVSSHWQLA